MILILFSVGVGGYLLGGGVNMVGTTARHGSGMQNVISYRLAILVIVSHFDPHHTIFLTTKPTLIIVFVAILTYPGFNFFVI